MTARPKGRRRRPRVRGQGRRYSSAVPAIEPTTAEPTTAEPTVQFNLAKAFDTLAETLGDRECIVWKDRRLTYAQVAERSQRLAAYLHGQGLGLRTERED